MTFPDRDAPVALVTGASGGIGRELADLLAADGHDLVIVARSEADLRELADEVNDAYGTAVVVLVKDLAERAAPREIFETLRDRDIEVDVLVNNAGFATFGPFVDLDLDREVDEIEVNVTALTQLTKLFLPGMLDRESGKVLNLGSTASFQPGPLMAVYYATKAYVLSFSEALAEECRGTGVTVTALCPGPTETGFQSRADMEDSRLLEGGVMDARKVAKAGIRGMNAGKAVVVPGTQNWLGSVLVRFLPRWLVRRIVKVAQRPT
ncbi:short-chain dehydrogenase/reductase SDR [Haloferax elongans ATCC BAA-1513]|uniref:Short-chain dehydrogenase/reductase SDR n=1 Tax=Haloferax elongans ATCC BAA-1513 TaxID=1230453 RepID=M0HFP7_HALEO|nr:SDR family oxidoreductase [Haloferax elongans]ELZ81909.1 short-chain dehydrogenase/reductase SDR [Haloferax elongans ATCC BAA-1513]